MMRPSIHGRFLAVLAPLIGLLACVMVAVGRGDPPRAVPIQDAKKSPPPAGLTPYWAETSQCENCHRPSPRTRNQITDFVALDEVDIWSNMDKHSDAFANLKNPLAVRMGEKLHYDVTKSEGCLNCHSPGFNTPMIAQTAVEEGVSCVACHGAFNEWIDAHGGVGNRQKQDAWVRRSAKDKHDNFGMNDLRDPAVRAEICASCHVGDKEKGRFVSHAMYAAGHPPLPGVEVATFSKGEPPHWWPMKNVPYFQKPENAGLREQYGIDQAPTQFAKLVAVGGVVSFRKAMNLFADMADAKGMPDFARFDCASCHHELRVSDQSFRQARGYGASEPGRPPVATWPTALMEVAISAGDPKKAKERKKELDDGLKALHAAIAGRPFGEKEKAKQAAQNLARWSDTLIAELDATKLDREAAVRMLHQIVAIDPPDHASARQLVWGFQAIYEELEPKLANDAPIQAILKDLIGRLKIELKPGDKKSINRDLGARLDADELYDPKALREALEQLEKLLPR